MYGKKIYLIFLCLWGIAQAGMDTGSHVLSIQHWVTMNGARVYFVAVPELPILDIKVAFDAGSARDAKQAGVAALTNAMLSQGATDLNADQIAEAFDSVGAEFSNGTDRDMAVLSLRSLTDPAKLKTALTVFTKVLTQPLFVSQDFNRVRQQTLTAIAAQQQSPATLATQAFYKQVFDSHPYAHPILGEPNSLQVLKASDLRNFYQRYYVARNEIIVLVGAMTTTQAKQIAEQITEALPSGNAATPLPLAARNSVSKSQQIFFPTTQMAIRMGQVGINRHSPDYFPLLVANHILGGLALNSRLYAEVRENRGLTYSVYSFFEPLAARGPFLIALETRAEKADQALQVMQQTLSHYLSQGPTHAELERAKQNLIGGFALRFDSNKAVAQNLLMLGFYQMPLDYFDTFRKKVEAVTSEQILQALNNHLDVKKMVIVKTVKKNT